MRSISLAESIRAKSLEMVHKAQASHIGSALSIADIVAVLYGDVMTIDPSDPSSPIRDRFILSKGHACVAVYAALAELGFISRESLETYGQDDSWLMNHISHKVEGVEFSTGALGHGLPFAVGKALSAKSKGESFRTFVVMSDGEMDEGANWEALMFAAHHELVNLTAIVDYNKLQSLSTVSNTLELEPLVDKLSAFGASVLEVDGHDHSSLQKAFLTRSSSKPMVVVAHTIKGKGVSFMEGEVAWHYKSPDISELQRALVEVDTANAQ